MFLMKQTVVYAYPIFILIDDMRHCAAGLQQLMY